MDEHKNLAHFYWIQKIIWIGPGPDRSSNLGPKTVKTGPKTDTGPVFARTDPTLVKTQKIKPETILATHSETAKILITITSIIPPKRKRSKYNHKKMKIMRKP